MATVKIDCIIYSEILYDIFIHWLNVETDTVWVNVVGMKITFSSLLWKSVTLSKNFWVCFGLNKMFLYADDVIVNAAWDDGAATHWRMFCTVAVRDTQ